jgi:hypothetical protein
MRLRSLLLRRSTCSSAAVPVCVAPPKPAPVPPRRRFQSVSRLPNLRRCLHAVAGEPGRVGAEGSPVRPGPRAALDLLHGAVGHRRR